MLIAIGLFAAALAGPPMQTPLPALSGAKPLMIQAYAEREALRAAGQAKTAVDRRFAEDDKVTGSLGFLCGIQPNFADKGAGAVYGVDPHGRFVGANLKLAF